MDFVTSKSLLAWKIKASTSTIAGPLLENGLDRPDMVLLACPAYFIPTFGVDGTREAPSEDFLSLLSRWCHGGGR